MKELEGAYNDELTAAAKKLSVFTIKIFIKKYLIYRK